MSHSIIFQLYLWLHIDVQAVWRRRLTYNWAPNAIRLNFCGASKAKYHIRNNLCCPSVCPSVMLCFCLHPRLPRNTCMLTTLKNYVCCLKSLLFKVNTQVFIQSLMAYVYVFRYDNIDLPSVEGDPAVLPPPYVVRTLLILGRSHCQMEMTDKQVGLHILYMSSFLVVRTLLILGRSHCQMEMTDKQVGLHILYMSSSLRIYIYSENPADTGSVTLSDGYDRQTGGITHIILHPFQL